VDGAGRGATAQHERAEIVVAGRPALADMELLVATGRITGYTVEPDPVYLRADVPVLTYSMSCASQAGRRNARLALIELRAAGARVEVVHRRGTWRWGPALNRSSEVSVIGWFDRPASLRTALRAIRARYVAGVAGAVPGSWRVPDVRVCGVAPAGTVPAMAHELPLPGGAAAVVISLEGTPPLLDMRSRPISLLPCWTGYLATAAG
jgi:hypothetical protein